MKIGQRLRIDCARARTPGNERATQHVDDVRSHLLLHHGAFRAGAAKLVRPQGYVRFGVGDARVDPQRLRVLAHRTVENERHAEAVGGSAETGAAKVVAARIRDGLQVVHAHDIDDLIGEAARESFE